MILQGFVGPAARVRSVNANAEKTLNWYVEQPPGTPKVPVWLAPTPGMRPYVLLADGPIRGLFAQDSRAFAVTGSAFYEVLASQTAVLRGTGAADAKPATISSNGTGGNQLFITSGGLGYIYNLLTNIITPIADVDFPLPVEMGAFSDGYFLALKRGTNQFNFSELNDGTLWDGLDFNQVSTVSDLLVALLVNHREVWLFGSQSTSVWANVGDVNNPFQPIGGVQMTQGCGAAYSAITIDNSILWLGENEHGGRVVYRANGYTGARVSDHGVEFALNQYPRVDDAIAFGYQDEGHTFYCLYLPTAPDPSTGVDHTTWCYDIATGAWHERAVWNSQTLRFEPWRARNHVYVFNKHLVGDRSGRGIYELSLDLWTDTLVI